MTTAILTALPTAPALVPMLSFLEPSRLWLLLLIPALVSLYLGLVRRGRRRRAAIGRTMFDLVIPRDRTWLRHVAVGLSILSLATLTLAFAKPKDEVSVPRERATIVVTIDVSLSMEATDVEPNRIEAAKAAAEDFVTSLPPKFNVAVVSFAGTATTLVPPTLDRGAATAAIQALQPQPSTAIGEGIYTSLAALAQVPPDPDDPEAVVPARIVLLSDGKTQVGRSSSEAAEAAKAQDVPIYTIAYGTADGYIEVSGRREPVPVDRSELARVSRVSGGEAYTATSAGQLKEVYEDIGSSVGTEKVDQEVTSRYAGFGLALAVLAAFGMISLGARWP
ncbi:Ca-activated chloride channel family protein [Friedmanniella luteola]|uniref:Ca-activated chloride channel family protein n=2 Tax=Friedmanniella luteola TaxID=546871 RepID=A0A1H1W5P1_9ACTN|nr:Ca-activated chloride channel family protein [Friedmanniella luteola]